MSYFGWASGICITHYDRVWLFQRLHSLASPRANFCHRLRKSESSLKSGIRAPAVWKSHHIYFTAPRLAVAIWLFRRFHWVL